MPIRNLRDFLSSLKKLNELHEIEKEIHWDQEASALGAMSNRIGGPAIHFKRVKNYSSYTLSTGLLTGPGTLWPKKRLPYTRQAVALGLDEEIAYNQVKYPEFIESLLERARHTLHATELSSGPCKEEIKIGDDVDLFEFPFPYIHDGDAGRYSTFHNLIVKDPETGWQEWGASRVMIYNKNTLIGSFLPTGHSIITIMGEGIHKIYKKYERLNKPTPFCLTIGGPPSLYIASHMYLAEGVDRAEVAGGLNLSPIEVVKAETCNLMVPAQAEIIIEGEILPHQRATEGPFGEKIAGYSDPAPQPLMKVKCITYRNDPILPFVVSGCKVSDEMAVLSMTASAEILRRLRLRGFEVKWVNLPVDWGLNTCVVSSKHYYVGYPYHLMRAIYSLSVSNMFDKLILVEDDVAPLELSDVMLDMVMKTHPKRGHHILEENAPLSPFAAYADKEERMKGVTAKFYTESMWPLQWKKGDIPTRLSFETCFPKEIQDRVKERWIKMGIKPDPKLIGR
jgi:4-hydroxy-3-polyprenylbenzoate decarboxylase